MSFAPASAPTADVPPPAPGWYRDPTGRHDKRLWNGFAWTSKVLTDDEYTPAQVAQNEPVVAAPDAPSGPTSAAAAEEPAEKRSLPRRTLLLIVAIVVVVGALVAMVASGNV